MAFLLHFLVLLLLSPHPAAYPYRKCEGDAYDAGSLFQSNLNLLLSSLSSINSTFVTDYKGSPQNHAYGLFLCRGDITSLPSCHNCALTATQDIQHLCPFSKQATVWYETCQLRYSDLSLNGSYYDIEPVIDSAEQKATDPDTFIKLRGELLDKLCERAAYNSSLLFATGTASVRVNDSPEIYGLVQCTRDLSKDKCYQCLQESFSDSLKQLDAVKGERVLEKSCNFRYEAFKFFEGVPAVLHTLPPSSTPPSSTPTQRKDGKDQIQQKQLNWEMRFKIIGGISQGLHYLHEESHFTVIHRDLKASNILLDADMNPKISDFGLSKLFGCEEKECTTRRIVGTLGYMAPEYITRGQFSMKSDVYSFGVLLLEIVTGKKRSKFHHSGNYNDLLSYTWEHWTNGTALEILDPSVKERFSENEALICIQIGLLCTQEVPADRPLMSSVLLMLNSQSVTLPAPSQPTFGFRPRTSTWEISEHIAASRNNASISVLEPR